MRDGKRRDAGYMTRDAGAWLGAMNCAPTAMVPCACGFFRNVGAHLCVRPFFPPVRSAQGRHIGRPLREPGRGDFSESTRGVIRDA